MRTRVVIAFTFCCGLAFLIGLMTSDRSNHVIGTWKWGARTVYFEESERFHSPGPDFGPMQSLEGGWEYSRGKVHFWNTIIDGDNPGWTFELSQSGRTLVALRGLQEDEATQMTKLSSDASR
jgi:hypothetical protein